MSLILTVLSYKGGSPRNPASATFDTAGGSLGRSAENQFVLPDPDKYISRKHGAIAYRDGSYYFTDTSTAGTYFISRGLLLQRDSTALADGDILRIGDYDISVSLIPDRQDAGVPAFGPFPSPPAPDGATWIEPAPGLLETDADPFAPSPPRPASGVPSFVGQADVSPFHESFSLPEVAADLPPAPEQALTEFDVDDLLRDLGWDNSASASQAPSAPIWEPAQGFAEDLGRTATPSSRPLETVSSAAEPFPEPFPSAGPATEIIVPLGKTGLAEAPPISLPPLPSMPELESDFLEARSEGRSAAVPAPRRTPSTETPTQPQRSTPIPAEPPTPSPQAEPVMPEPPAETVRVGVRPSELPTQTLNALPMPRKPPDQTSRSAPVESQASAPAGHSAPITPDRSMRPGQPSEAGPVSSAPPAGSHELLMAFLKGAGLQPGDWIKEENLPAVLELTGILMRDLVEGMMTVLRARAEMKSQFRVSATIMRAANNNPLKFTVNVSEALKILLAGNHPGFQNPVDAVREGCADLMNHQMALTAGTQASLAAALKAFDPTRFEKPYEEGIVFQKKAKCWDAYCKAYPQLVNDILENFFGEEFADVYERQMRILKSTKTP